MTAGIHEVATNIRYPEITASLLLSFQDDQTLAKVEEMNQSARDLTTVEHQIILGVREFEKSEHSKKQKEITRWDLALTLSVKLIKGLIDIIKNGDSNNTVKMVRDSPSMIHIMNYFDQEESSKDY